MRRWIRGSQRRRTREGENSVDRDCGCGCGCDFDSARGGEGEKTGSSNQDCECVAGVAGVVEDDGDAEGGNLGLDDGGRGQGRGRVGDRGRYRRAGGGRSDRESGLDGDVFGGGYCEARYDHLADPTPCAESPYPCRGPWWPEHSGQARRAARLVGGQLLETHAASIDALAGPQLAGESGILGGRIFLGGRVDWRADLEEVVSD